MKRGIFVSMVVLLMGAPLSYGAIEISDGPSGKSQSHPEIVTTNGPAELPYVWPPKIVTSDGPAQLFYKRSAHAPVVSDGPGTSRSAELPRVEVYPLPDPEAQTLAPMIPASPEPVVAPVARQVNSPAVTESAAMPAPIAPQAETYWKTIAITAASLAAIMMAALLWAFRRYVLTKS